MEGKLRITLLHGYRTSRGKRQHTRESGGEKEVSVIGAQERGYSTRGV